MKFGLIRPCPHCPFRNDIDPYLRAGRAQEIAGALRRGGTFTCHKTNQSGEDEETGESITVETSDSQHCAGALIILEKEENPNQLMRIAERIGSYDASKLDMDAPVYDDLDEWVEAHGGDDDDEYWDDYIEEEDEDDEEDVA